MGALIDLFVGVGEVTFMLILVTPDGVVTLGMFGQGFNFSCGEFFHFSGDVHGKSISGCYGVRELGKTQMAI